jgi:hypothetical protein
MLTSVLLTTLLLATGADAHGYLLYPASRAAQAFSRGINYCPHCGQGQGKNPPSICGDPFQNVGPTSVPLAARFFGYDTVLAQGQTLNVTVRIHTNHGGRMRLALCPFAHGDGRLNHACFNRSSNWLRRVSSDPGVNGRVYWYLTEADTPTDGAAFKDTSARFRLPASVSCARGCVLGWWWVGTQSCTLPCENTRTIDDAAQCGRNAVNPSVGRCTDPLRQTEMYYGCADVIVQPTITRGMPPPPRRMPPPPPPAASECQGVDVGLCRRCVAEI